MSATDDDIRGWMVSLMVSDNLGDVHDVLTRMAASLGFELEGDYLDGWTEADFANVEAAE